MTIRNGNHHFAAHDLAFHVGVRVVFARPVVMVDITGSIERREFLQPFLIIMMQAGFVVVDEDRCGAVRRFLVKYA